MAANAATIYSAPENLMIPVAAFRHAEIGTNGKTYYRLANDVGTRELSGAPATNFWTALAATAAAARATPLDAANTLVAAGSRAFCLANLAQALSVADPNSAGDWVCNYQLLDDPNTKQLTGTAGTALRNALAVLGGGNASSSGGAPAA